MPLARVIAQAQPAHAKAAVKRPRPPAQGTAIIFPHLEFIRPFRLNSKTFLGQWISPSLTTGKRHS
jgi:hypothetical protein